MQSTAPAAPAGLPGKKADSAAASDLAAANVAAASWPSSSFLLSRSLIASSPSAAETSDLHPRLHAHVPASSYHSRALQQPFPEHLPQISRPGDRSLRHPPDPRHAPPTLRPRSTSTAADRPSDRRIDHCVPSQHPLLLAFDSHQRIALFAKTLPQQCLSSATRFASRTRTPVPHPASLRGPPPTTTTPPRPSPLTWARSRPQSTN